ncbi:MAG: SurA N-terminal domain-containing protein [Gaiellaceae bacterium]
MKRWRVFLPVLGAASLLLPLAGCGDTQHQAVAHVGGTAITAEQLRAGIEQIRADRRRKGEGEEFPDPGTAGYKHVQDSVLALLVLHAELEHAADRLGVTVDDGEVDRLIDAGGGAPGESEGGSLGKEAREFARESVRAQLLYQRIYERVTRGAQDRRVAMSRFVQRLRASARVRYEPGYAPGS